MLWHTAQHPPFLVYHEVRKLVQYTFLISFLYSMFPFLISGFVSAGSSSSGFTYSSPDKILYSAVGLTSPSRPYFPDQKKAGTFMSTRTCSTYLSSLSLICLVGGHSVILVKVFLITASYVGPFVLAPLTFLMAFFYLAQ